MRTTDDLLTHLGTGRWNFIFFTCAAIWTFLVPLQILSGAFLVPVLPYTCKPPTHRNVTAVASDSCSYKYEAAQGEEKDEPCTQWVFNTTVFASTITSDYELVCHREYLRATFTSLYMIGNTISPVVWAYCADRYGRWMIIAVCHVLFTGVAITTTFLNSLPLLMAARFITGFCNINTIYVLALEVCEIRHRGTVGIVTVLPWAFGTMALGGIGYLIRQWRWLQLAISLPNLIFLPALWFLDESPRWLMVHGRQDRVLKLLHKAARFNGAHLPPDSELMTLMATVRREAECKDTTQGTHPSSEVILREETAEEEPSAGQTQVEDSVPDDTNTKRGCHFPVSLDICSRGVRVILVIMSINYFTAGMVYYGLNLNGGNLNTDPYLYLVLAGLMELPSYTVMAYIIERFGRKRPTIIGYFVCSVALLSLAFIPRDVSWLVVSLVMVGKLCISCVYQTIMVYLVELLPTMVRIQGMGVAKLSARGGAIFSPFITDLMVQKVSWGPSVVFGVMSLVAGVATFWASETKNVPLPDTILDVHNGTPSKKSQQSETTIEDCRA